MPLQFDLQATSANPSPDVTYKIYLSKDAVLDSGDLDLQYDHAHQTSLTTDQSPGQTITLTLDSTTDESKWLVSSGLS